MTSNRIAVFLRGMQRTWPHIKPHTLYLFDRLFGVDSVDWYVAVWKTVTSKTSEELKQDFAHRNLIFCESVPLGKYPLRNMHVSKTQLNMPQAQLWKGYKSGYWNLAYLDHLMITEKIKYELKNRITYDRVFFIRPDMYYRCDDLDLLRKPLQDFEIDGLRYYDVGGNLATDDLYYQTNSITADVLCSRFLDTYTEFKLGQMMLRCPHALMGQYISRNYLNPIGNEHSVELVIVRPDQLDSIDNVAQLNKDSWQSWAALTTEQRIAVCHQQNIDPTEYGL